MACMMAACSSDIHLSRDIPSLASSGSNVFRSSYHFYIPSSIGRFESTDYSYVLDHQGTEFQMTLNLSSILFEHPKSWIKKPNFEGNYMDVYHRLQSYRVFYEELSNKKYYLVYESPAFIGTSVCEKVELKAIIKAMVQISQSLQKDENALRKKLIKSNRKKYIADIIPLFEKKLPKEGRIEDLFRNDSIEEKEKNIDQQEGD